MKKARRKSKNLSQVLTNIFIDPYPHSQRHFNATQNPQTNGRFFIFYFFHCRCCCVTWLRVWMLFTLLSFYFLFFSFIFMIIAVIQFSVACAIRFHLFTIEIFMRCDTFAHSENVYHIYAFCFYAINSFYSDCCCCCLERFFKEIEREIHVCFYEVI